MIRWRLALAAGIIVFVVLAGLAIMAPTPRGFGCIPVLWECLPR